MINKRIFGSDIPKKIKGILQARQIVAQSSGQNNGTFPYNPITLINNIYDPKNPGEVTEYELEEFLPQSVINFPTNGGSLVDLYSRTPFIRMWTAVGLTEATEYEEIFEAATVDPNDYYETFQSGPLKGTSFPNIEAYHGAKGEAKQDAEKKARDYSESLGASNTFLWDTVKNAYVVKHDVEYKKLTEPKIYTIGNYNLDTFEKTPNTPVGATVLGSAINSTSNPEILFPDEHQGENDNNKFLKPQAGITGLSSTTEGRLGAIKKTTINFIVHNFQDFQNIYQRYFLRPAAQIFVDFGWDTSDIYDQNLFISETKMNEAGYKNMEQILFAESAVDSAEDDGFVTKSMGNMETLIGVVTNYDTKILKNGSFECMVEITSKNSALLGNEYENESQSYRRIKYICENLIFDHALNLLLERTIKCVDQNDEPILNAKRQEITTQKECEEVGGTLKEYSGDQYEKYKQNRPNASTTAQSVTDYNIAIKESLRDYLNTPLDISAPYGISVSTGVYIHHRDADAPTSDVHYISWGVIEDLIINPEFGFGANTKDINEGNNFQIRLDSRNSFTSWDEKGLWEKQKNMLIYADSDESPLVIYPYPDASEGSVLTSGYEQSYQNTSFGWDETYSTQENKSPENKYYKVKYESLSDEEINDFGITNPSDIIDFTSEDKSLMLKTKLDKKLGRIPLREVFIRADKIYTAFAGEGSVPKALNSLLEAIKNDTYGIMDWRIANNGDDTKLSIIDNNVMNIEHSEELDNSKFDNIFEFKVMSPDTIINEYNLSFSMPQGQYGNMVAISGMKGGDQLIATSDILDTLLATEDIEMNNEEKNKFVSYLPEIGPSRYKKIQGDAVHKQFLDYIYDRVDSIVGIGNPMGPSAHGSGFYLPQTLFESNYSMEAKEDSTSSYVSNTVSANHSNILKMIVDNMKDIGFLVADKMTTYYQYVCVGDFFREKRPTPLPLYLTLKMYGISSLVPGDIFRVDYLPKKYRDSIYFQVIRVAHSVDSAGWYTTLETQFRIRPSKKRFITRSFNKVSGVTYSNSFMENITNVPEITVLDTTP